MFHRSFFIIFAVPSSTSIALCVPSTFLLGFCAILGILRRTKQMDLFNYWSSMRGYKWYGKHELKRCSTTVFLKVSTDNKHYVWNNIDSGIVSILGSLPSPCCGCEGRMANMNKICCKIGHIYGYLAPAVDEVATEAWTALVIIGAVMSSFASLSLLIYKSFPLSHKAKGNALWEGTNLKKLASNQCSSYVLFGWLHTKHQIPTKLCISSGLDESYWARA